MSAPEAADDIADELLIDRLQQAAFGYFLDYRQDSSGLIADTSRPASPCSIAVVGFALSCYPIAVERGWITRDEAATLILKTLQFFWDSDQGGRPNSSGYRGFYYHFLDMHTGRRVWGCELSLIDTALLLAGALTAAAYFDGEARESHIRRLASGLVDRVEWPWALNGGDTLAQGWKPETGFLHYGWEGYNEATLLYVLAMGSSANLLPPTCFTNWTATYQWENLLGIDTLYSGPLFTHLFSHAWIDFRQIRDPFMRQVQSDYFQNTQSAIAVQREYAARNPRGFTGYSRTLWGISAGDGPANATALSPRDQRHFGYMARGAPFGPDDGTLCPWAMLAALPFAPAAALMGTRHLLARYPQVCVHERFVSGFNPSVVVQGSPWLSEGWYGLDQGLLVMMIENFRSGLIWKLAGQSSVLRAGLQAAGFQGGWLNP